jgi:hypothetical protein
MLVLVPDGFPELVTLLIAQSTEPRRTSVRLDGFGDKFDCLKEPLASLSLGLGAPNLSVSIQAGQRRQYRWDMCLAGFLLVLHPR